jgi:hypothetical protein
MVDLKRLAQRMKLHKIDGTVVHHCAILVKVLRADDVQARIVHGYAVTPGEICEHFWVRVEPEGLDMDIGWELARLYSPELSNMRIVLAEEFPAGLKDKDGQEPDVLRQPQNRDLFELWETDPKTFWNEAPKNVRTFR